jgi:RHS repeat-associated protein
MKSSLNGVQYFHQDHLGSTSKITNAQGTVVRSSTYFPYGSLQYTSGTKDNAHKFTGQILDDNTGLYYYNARYYDPVLCTFVTPDTVIQDPYDPQSLNRYAYCRNNPIIYADPDGHWFFLIPMIVGALMGGTHGSIANLTNGNFDWSGAGIGAASGLAGYGAGSWAFSASGGGLGGLFAGGFAGGAAGGGVGGGLTAARYGGDVMQGALMGAASGALSGLASGGLTAMGLPASLASAGGSFASAYIMSGGDPKDAWEAAGSGFGASIIGAALTTYTPLGTSGRLDPDSDAYADIVNRNRTYVSTPGFDGLDDIQWNLIALLDGGFSHTGHGQDVKYEPFGHRYRTVGTQVAHPNNSEDYNYIANYNLITNNCSTRFGYQNPSTYNSHYNYSDVFYWRK